MTIKKHTSDKIPKVSTNIVEEKIKALQQIIPECFSEGVLNVDELRRSIGEMVHAGDEKFSLNWQGKNNAKKNISVPSKATLIPIKNKSVNFDTTKNIFIEGDNLETLKLLRKSYFGKIKMIYIDPPYNTGNDFIYKDNYYNGLELYLEQTGQTKNGNKMTTNLETSGRFHSDWMSFMYPRLFLARDLLSDDGLIFISINDKEVNNLKYILNDIFGEKNFIVQFVWNTEGSTDNQLEIKIVHEYVIMYAKNIANKNKSINNVIAPDIDKSSKIYNDFIENTAVKNSPGNPPKDIELPKGFPCEIDTLSLDKTKIGKKDDDENKFYDAVNNVGYITRALTNKYDLEYPIRKNKMHVKNKKIIKKCIVFSGWANSNKFQLYIDNNMKPVSNNDGDFEFYLSKNGVLMYKKQRKNPSQILSVIRNVGTTNKAKLALEKLNISYDYPKPTELIKYLIQIGTKSDEIVLDFFAGSGTTAHSIIELNNEDGGNRQFILVQFPEIIKHESNEFSTISNLCVERITRVIKKLMTGVNSKQDLGFKMFKMAKSNYKDWEIFREKDEEKLKKQMRLFEFPLIEKYGLENVIYEIIIKKGLSLNSNIEKINNIKSNIVHKISDNEHILYIILDKKIKIETINKLKLTSHDILICLDNALDDSQKMNMMKQQYNLEVI